MTKANARSSGAPSSPAGRAFSSPAPAAGSKADKARQKAKAKAKAEAEARKAEWKKDPKHCEVCLKVMTDLHGQVKALKHPSKCDRCRERGRQSYMQKRVQTET